MLILTTFDLDEYVLEALRAGARGFLLKDAGARQLIDAVRTVARGISEATVKRHVARVLGKLGLRDRVQIAIFAYRHGLESEA